MRGERTCSAAAISPVDGSSPHARGTRVLHSVEPVLGRIIPACAGNAPREGGGVSGHPDHPRMRGERMATFAERVSMVGSSPHARGTLSTTCREPRQRRIIPACAGNATWAASCTSGRTDHPRMRGERIDPVTRDLLDDGSSPHARGTLARRERRERDRRIIPACAGNAPTATFQSAK